MGKEQHEYTHSSPFPSRGKNIKSPFCGFKRPSRRSRGVKFSSDFFSEGKPGDNEWPLPGKPWRNLPKDVKDKDAGKATLTAPLGPIA